MYSYVFYAVTLFFSLCDTVSAPYKIQWLVFQPYSIFSQLAKYANTLSDDS